DAGRPGEQAQVQRVEGDDPQAVVADQGLQPAQVVAAAQPRQAEAPQDAGAAQHDPLGAAGPLRGLLDRRGAGVAGEPGRPGPPRKCQRTPRGPGSSPGRAATASGPAPRLSTRSIRIVVLSDLNWPPRTAGCPATRMSRTSQSSRYSAAAKAAESMR